VDHLELKLITMMIGLSNQDRDVIRAWWVEWCICLQSADWNQIANHACMLGLQDPDQQFMEVHSSVERWLSNNQAFWNTLIKDTALLLRFGACEHIRRYAKEDVARHALGQDPKIFADFSHAKWFYYHFT
jgi:hypothetical protein